MVLSRTHNRKRATVQNHDPQGVARTIPEAVPSAAKLPQTLANEFVRVDNEQNRWSLQLKDPTDKLPYQQITKGLSREHVELTAVRTRAIVAAAISRTIELCAREAATASPDAEARVRALGGLQ
jgi:hypothetical protein